jgi:hypothetical protein
LEVLGLGRKDEMSSSTGDTMDSVLELILIRLVTEIHYLGGLCLLSQ